MTAQTQFSKFKDWKRKLLIDRGLSQPDGRSLYQYRLTQAEFTELEQLLGYWLDLFSSTAGLDSVTRVTSFPGLYVLYAAEWWRRRYDGSGFSWEPILRDLNADPNDWTPGERSQCVKDGLREWGLKPRESGALRFLGTVAIQGGLPLRLLVEAHSSVGSALHRVLQLAEGREVTQTEVHGWIESLQSRLPKSYRREMIFTLLTDIVMVVLRLKQEARLSANDDVIEVLNRKIPDWKERFPLSLEDEYARGLVEQLVKEAVRVRVRKVKTSLPVERFLEQREPGEWTLGSRVELPNTLPNNQITALFEIEKEEVLPRTATLSLQVGKHRFQTAIRRLAGQNSYRVDPDTWELVGEESMDEHIFRLSAPDGRLWSVEAHKGSVLDDELPWLFFADETPHNLLRQGSGSVAATDVLLVAPRNWRIDSLAEGEASDSGYLEVPPRKVTRVCGQVGLTNEEGQVFLLRTGHAGAKEQHLAWKGKRLWLDFLSPSKAFCGLPKLKRMDDEGGSSSVNGRPACTVLGTSVSTLEIGPVTLRYPAHGESQLRSRMVLLPQQASLKLEPRDAASGWLRFSNWGINTAKVLGAPVQQHVMRENDALLLDVSVARGERAPQWLEIELGWPHTTHPVRLRAPFPASGVRAFDAEGRELQPGARMALQQLLGSRLLVSDSNHQGGMVLLIGSPHRRISRRYPLSTSKGALALEIALSDYLSDIQQVLSIDNSPDAKVPVSVLLGGREVFTLHVARYSAMLEPEFDYVYLEVGALERLSAQDLEQLSVLAMRLEHPEDEPVTLETRFSEGVSAGAWDFEPSQRESGSWLIYPGHESSVPFRPTMWPIDGDTTTDNPLAEAINTPNQVERLAAIDRVIADMAADFKHPAWTMVEQLARQMGYLPLATLDLWRQFAQSFYGMAAMAMRMGSLPKGFYLRFAEELPFAWEVVPIQCWTQAIDQLKQQCQNLYGEIAETIFINHLDSRKGELWAECGALHYLLGLASAGFDDRFTKEIGGLRAYGAIAAEVLFEGNDSQLMALRRRHVNENNWPTDFNRILIDARKHSEISQFLCPASYGFQDGVINMPLLSAAMVAMNETWELFSDSNNIHLLRSLRAFDPDWFDDAYNLIVAYGLAKGVFDE